MKLQISTEITGLRNNGVFASLLVACLFSLIGCDSNPASFQVNEAYIRAVEYKADVTKPLMREAETQLSTAQIQNVSEIMEGLFGTPDEPNLPGGVGLEDFLSLRKLKIAAGPVTYTGEAGSTSGLESGLYRRHCAHCHGVSGDGHGPTAQFLNP